MQIFLANNRVNLESRPRTTTDPNPLLLFTGARSREILIYSFMRNTEDEGRGGRIKGRSHAEK